MTYIARIVLLLLSLGTILSGALACLDVGRHLFTLRHAQIATLASH